MSCVRHSGVVISLPESMIPEIDGREETSILSVCVALNYTMFPVVLVFQQQKKKYYQQVKFSIENYYEHVHFST